MSFQEQVNTVCRLLPKADLHVHLDGSVRPERLQALMRAAPRPREMTLEEIRAAVTATRDCDSLTDYLSRFDLINRYLRGPETLAAVASDLMEGFASENVRYAEVRFCPFLHASDEDEAREVVVAVLDALKQGGRDHGVRAGLILCALREQETEMSMKIAKMAIELREQGVVALDLAGDELNFKAEPHYPAFDLAGEAGLPRVVHAGEASGPENVKEAITKMGAERVGHGTRLLGDLPLMQEISSRGVVLEVCLTSNVQTRAVSSLAGHPFARYLRSHIAVTINTDNRTVSDTNSSRELAHAWIHGDLAPHELKKIILNGFEAGYLPSEQKALLKDQVEKDVEGILAEHEGLWE
jgi:adenosine deaminase